MHTVMEENGMPILFAARLKVVDRKLTEIETMVVKNRDEGALWGPDNLQEPTAMMRYTPTAAERMPRAQMVEIAGRYPAGLKTGSFEKSDVPFAPNAYRFENGVRMAGPGCTFQPPSCENMRTQRIPTLAGLTQRLVAVDEEMGVVLFWMNFGPGSLPGAGGRALVDVRGVQGVRRHGARGGSDLRGPAVRRLLRVELEATGPPPLAPDSGGTCPTAAQTLWGSNRFLDSVGRVPRRD